MTKKKRYTSEEKTIILREHLENQVTISDLSEKYGIHANAIYKWKKQMFEEAPSSFNKTSNKINHQSMQDKKRIAELEAKLQQRETLIAELVEDNLKLKKKTGGVL